MTCTPATYDDGNASSHSPRACRRRALASTDATTADRDRTTRLGWPVDPDVSMIIGAASAVSNHALNWAMAIPTSGEGRR